MAHESRNINKLLEIMARLRDPKDGCPWDVEQDFASIAPYTIEEAYEVADAIERQDMRALKEELGDLLLQVVYHAQMAHEAGAFDFDAVACGIGDKMVRRHPHVFGTVTVDTAEAQTQAWEAHKAEERSEKAAGDDVSTLDGVPLALPALLRAEKLQKRAARVGFDWEDLRPVFDKIEEELGELESEVSHQGSSARLHEELGDLLFAVVNLARRLKIDPETALRYANSKFETRFKHVEAQLADRGKTPPQSTLAEMDALWDLAKAAEFGKKHE